MKKLLIIGLVSVLFGSCKKEDPIKSSVIEPVSLPEVTVYMDNQYIALPGDPFDSQIIRVDGYVGYAVDTVYGFEVNGEIVDTIFFTDPVWNGDTTAGEGVVFLDLNATNTAGISASGSSIFVMVNPPTDPYLEDISGVYDRTEFKEVEGVPTLFYVEDGEGVVEIVKVADGAYLVYNPIFSINTQWLDTYCICYHSISKGLDFIDQPIAFPGFGKFTYDLETYDSELKTIGAAMLRESDNLSLYRNCTRQ